MNISYDSYRIFYHAAKFQGFTQAAGVLGSSQSNVTRSIRNLEAALGCKLFVRSNRGARLTPEGEKLYGHIALAFQHIQAGEDELASRQGLQSGVVTVAASEIALRCCLLPVLRDYRARYPGVRIRVSNHSTPQAIDVLRSGLADFAVVTAPQHLPKTLRRRRLMAVQDVPVAGAAFAHLRGRTLTLGELVRLPLVGLGPRTATYDFYHQFFSAEGLSFRPDIETATADQILPMVKSGLGVGFVPEELVREDVLTGNLFAIALEKAAPRRSVCLLQQEDQPLSVAARELERMLTAGSGRKPPL